MLHLWLPLVALPRVSEHRVRVLLQGLLQSGSHAEIVAELLKLICKALWSATYMGIPDMLIQQDHFVGWMTCLHTLMDMPVPKACLDFLPACCIQLDSTSDLQCVVCACCCCHSEPCMKHHTVWSIIDGLQQSEGKLQCGMS